MTEFIDPEELPFTEKEVFTAARLFLPEQVARNMAAHLLTCGPGVIEAREQRRASWRAAGMVDAHWQSLHAWGYPADLLPALASLSGDAEARALFLMEDRWRGLYRNVIDRMQREALEAAGIMPIRKEIVRLANTSVKTKGEKKLLQQGLVSKGPPPPLPTTQMVSAAHAHLGSERSNWRAQVQRFRDHGQSGENVDIA